MIALFKMIGSATRLYLDFTEFINAYDGPDVKDGDALIGYIYLWLREGNAVIESGGDFGTFIKGVLYIITNAPSRNYRLDFTGSMGKTPIKRSTKFIVNGPEDIETHPVFDPEFFRTVLMRRIASR